MATPAEQIRQYVDLVRAEREARAVLARAKRAHAAAALRRMRLAGAWFRERRYPIGRLARHLLGKGECND